MIKLQTSFIKNISFIFVFNVIVKYLQIPEILVKLVYFNNGACRMPNILYYYDIYSGLNKIF